MSIAQRSFFWLWLVSTPFLGILYVSIPPSPDHSLFDYIAWISRQGQPYYAGAFELNWPGMMILHELGQRVFGTHAWSFRLTDFILLQGIAWGGVLTLRRSGFDRGALAFLLLYPPLYVTSGIWVAGQRDIVATGLALIAIAASMNRQSRTVLGALLAGAILAYAAMIRPTFLAFFVGMILVELLPVRESGGTPRPGTSVRQRRIIALIGGFAAIMILAVLAGLTLGNLDDWYQQAVQFTALAYQDSASRFRLVEPFVNMLFRFWHWITALGCVGLGWWALSSVGPAGVCRLAVDRGFVLIAGLAATIVLSFVSQNKGFGYHLGGLLTVFTIGLSVLIDRLLVTNRVRKPLVVQVMSAVCVGVILLGMAKKLSSLAPNATLLVAERKWPVFPPEIGYMTLDEIEKSVQRIRTESRPEDRIVQWGTVVTVGYLAERLPSTRFINTPVLSELGADFPHSRDWLREMAEGLDRHRPAFVLIERRALGREEAPFAAPAAASEALRLLIERIKDYEVAERFGMTLLLKRPGL